MRRAAFGLALVLGGCTWSNSLYQARVLSGQALTAEREHRTGEAAGDWGQVIAKADSAFARAPRGKRGAEAEWLLGRALARTQDCGDAVTALDVALIAAPTARWRESLLLELGRCKEATGDLSAGADFAELVSSRDTAIRHEARIHDAHALVRAGRWDEALGVLGTLEDRGARIDRADALLALGRSAAALAELAPLLAVADTAVPWNHFAEAMAAVDTPRSDSLLAALNRFPHATDEQRAGWLLTAMRGALGHDSTAAARRLTELLTHPPGRSVYDARGYAQLHALSAAADPQRLAVLLDSLKVGDDRDNGGSLPAMHAEQLRDQADRIVALDRSTPRGAPQGDMVVFALGERSRDSLDAPRLAAAFFRRLERDWPDSPYVPKALLARAQLEPDSAAALLSRFTAFPSSPYVAQTRGIVDPRLPTLEDSLDVFVRKLLPPPAAGAGTIVPPDNR